MKKGKINGLCAFLYAVFSLFLFISKIHAEPSIIWDKTYGGTGSEIGFAVLQTADGGFVFAGRSSSFETGADAYLVKTDSAGNQQWCKTFGGFNFDTALSIESCTDGGFILAGRTESFNSGYYELYVVKTDANGNFQWHKNFGAANYENICGEEIKQTSDGGYIITGLITSQTFPSAADLCLMKINSSGSLVLFKKKFGGPDFDWGTSVQPTTDGGFIAAGSTNSYGAGNYDIFLVKTDSAGNKLWQRTFGASGYDYGESVLQTDDGGFVIAGSSNSFGAGDSDIYIVKTDSNGNFVWHKFYGAINSSEYCASIQRTTDGGYVAIGTKDSCLYILKLNSAGDKLWDKIIAGSSYSYGYCVQQTGDGGFVIAGETITDTDDYQARLVRLGLDYLQGDINYDGRIDFSDFSLFSHSWMSQYGQSQFNQLCDLKMPLDNTIDYKDLEILLSNWLAENR